MPSLPLARLAFVVLALGAPGVADEPAPTPYQQLGLGSSYPDGAKIFDASMNPGDLERGVGQFIAATIAHCRSHALSSGRSPQSIANLAGNWLESSLLYALQQKKLTPVYWQAEFNAVRNAFNDVTLWSKEHGPIIVSCKTSLRERYKQADLEAVALRATYPNGKFFLLTVDSDKRHVRRTQRKIPEGEIMALHRIFDETDVDELIEFLQTQTLEPIPAEALRGGAIVR